MSWFVPSAREELKSVLLMCRDAIRFHGCARRVLVIPTHLPRRLAIFPRNVRAMIPVPARRISTGEPPLPRAFHARLLSARRQSDITACGTRRKCFPSPDRLRERGG